MKKIILAIIIAVSLISYFVFVKENFSMEKCGDGICSMQETKKNCEKDCKKTASECKKWNPGHYILLSSGTTQKEVEEIVSNPDNYIKGVQVGYFWRDLEPEKDAYNFSLIEDHLKIAKKYDKQLFISFNDRSWHAEDKAVPDYLLNEAQYKGGVEPMTKSHAGSSIARLWDPSVMERSNKLIEEIGKKFDSNPNFEGINFDESSLDINTKTAVGYSGRAYANALISRADSTAKAFPNSTVIMYMNYGPPELISVINHLPEIGVGMGGPDLVPDQGRFDYKPRVPAYEYYPKLAGKVPLGTAVQSENLVKPEWYIEYCSLHPENTRTCAKDGKGNYWRRKGDFTLDGFWDMGTNTLKLNYIFWQNIKGERYKFQFKEDILPYINEKKGEINDACPESKKI